MCREVIFHFNKKHLEDPTIPMWAIKTHGQTFYVNHVSCECRWSTKESPDNPHTKGSIKVKDCLLSIDSENSATLQPLTDHDRERLKHQNWGAKRIIFSSAVLEKALVDDNIDHTPIKTIGGGCSTLWRICDILNVQQLTILSLKYPDKFRILNVNESYYKLYDDGQMRGNHIEDEDEEDYDDVDLYEE